jgi:ADP-dependent NAD(P)H-hydrate dehydratase / NAD(P)H-hydrate epimerase
MSPGRPMSNANASTNFNAVTAVRHASADTTPRDVQAALTDHPLHDRAQTRRIEATALASAPAHALMDRAGLATARLAQALAPHVRRIVALAGPGNNGGDALMAAWYLHRHLQPCGVDVQVLMVGDRTRWPADAAQAWQQVQAAGLTVHADLAAIAHADLLLDGLLGVGGTRAPDGLMAEVIQAANASGLPILAIDVPSGLDADTGRPWGKSAIRATWTVSLLTLKPGLFTAEGRDLAGSVWHCDLGCAPADAPAAWLGAAATPPRPGLPARRHAQHKGSFGDVFVVGGASGMVGAARLAARAALTAGAGRVYVSPLIDPADGGAAAELVSFGAVPELMMRPCVWLEDAAVMQRSTLVCGCGGGTAVAAALPPLLLSSRRLVLDADALNAIAADSELQARLAARQALGAVTILTPHPLEAARLLGTSTTDVQADRLRAAKTLSERFGVLVVLKGSGTVVAGPGRQAWINASGNAMLATPGSGDVLAGWMGGLWSQSIGLSDEAGWNCARLAVWTHGRAADDRLAGRHGHAAGPLLASHLIDAMAGVGA